MSNKSVRLFVWIAGGLQGHSTQWSATPKVITLLEAIWVALLYPCPMFDLKQEVLQ